jgi:putative hydrolase of the HAD superfamily
MTSRVRAVAFDYGRVLSGPQDAECVSRMHALSGIAPGDFEGRYRAQRLAYDNGEVTDHEYWTNMLRHGGREPTPALIAQLMAADVESWLGVDERMLAWARSVAARGITIAILSNMPSALLAALQAKHGAWLEEFPVRVFSCDVGCVKPGRAIYDLTINRLAVPADRVLFLDDKSENIEGAREAGMQTIHFTTADALAREPLDSLGLPGLEHYNEG